MCTQLAGQVSCSIPVVTVVELYRTNLYHRQAQLLCLKKGAYYTYSMELLKTRSSSCLHTLCEDIRMHARYRVKQLVFMQATYVDGYLILYIVATCLTIDSSDFETVRSIHCSSSVVITIMMISISWEQEWSSTTTCT